MLKLFFSHRLFSIYFVFFAVLVLSSSSLFALPQDGSVRSGDVQLNQVNSKHLDVHQSTDKAIIDWHSFNIAQDEHTHFQMPSSDSLNLSRVTGGQRSDIFGKLSSNGRLMLINPNGVVFGQNSRIDVHGLVATTNDIRNHDFLANRFHFNIPGNPSARIINRGTINIGNAGLLAFVAPGVENSGVINARLGRVGLASSNQFTLDLYGDNLITLGVEGKVLETVYGEDGRPISSLINQSGTINADGGQVYLQTNAARKIVDHAINVSGIIEAKTAVKNRGNIILNGSNEGKVKVSGELNASGLESGQTGGVVHVLGDGVVLEKARIFASGFNGGGIVLVGGDYQGKGSVLNARNNYFDIDSKIYADATNNGNGGKVILWADERTDAFGKIFARGGAFGGDGGFVETSGKQILAVTQAADVSAPFGKPGEWLLDPFDIEIVDSLSNAALTGGNKVDVAIINAALNNGTSVKIQSNNNGAGEGNILLTSAISKTSGTDATLTLDAAGGITINNTITSTSGALTLAFMAATGVVVNNDLTLNGGTVTLNSNETFSRTNFENPGRQNIVQISHLSGAALPAAAHVSGTPGGLVHLSGNQNTANTSAGHGATITLSGVSVSTSGGSATFQDAVDLTTNSSSVSTSNGTITFNGALNGAQTLSLTAATGNVVFNGIIGGSTALSGLTINSSSSTTFSSDASFDGDVFINSLSGISLNGSWTISSSGSNSTLNADSDTDGSGTFSLGSNASLANSSIFSVIAGDFDFQGTHTGNTLDLFWNSLGGTIGIGDALGSARIDNSELGRIRNFQLTDTNSFFRTNLGTILIDNVQNAENSADFRATNIRFLNGSSNFKQLVFRGENVSFETNVSVTGLIVGDKITNLNFLGDSSLTTSSIGSGSGIGDSMTITGTNLVMSSSSTLDSGPGKMSLSFTKGITLGLLKTTSSKNDAISLDVGSEGIRDADTDGSLDIFVPNGTLLVNATGGFGTFENPIEFNVGLLDIPSSEDFSSSSVLANRTFSTTIGQSLQTVSTSRTFRASSDSFNLVSYLPVFNVSVSPIIAVGNYLPTLRPLLTNIFSQNFSILETTTTTTSFTSTFLTPGSSNIQFGNLFALDALNNSSLGSNLFSQVSGDNNSGSDTNSNFGLQSLTETSRVSNIFQRTTITRSTQFQSFGLGANQFGGRIPIGTRSLGTVRTIGGGIATCLLSPSGTVRAVNVLADSNGGINSQNNFNNVGLSFPLPSSPNIGRTSSPNNTGSGSNSSRTTTPSGSTVDARISGGSTPIGNTTNASNTRDTGASSLGATSPQGSNVDARISGSSTPNINANISGGSTSVRARISGGETLGVNSNISGSTTSSTSLNLGSRTNDRNLNNPDQFQGNANAEQRSLDARISGNETPGQTRNSSSSNPNLDNRMREMRNRLVANSATERESSSTSDVSEPTLQQRMSRLYSRIVGRNTSTNISPDDGESN